MVSVIKKRKLRSVCASKFADVLEFNSYKLPDRKECAKKKVRNPSTLLLVRHRLTRRRARRHVLANQRGRHILYNPRHGLRIEARDCGGGYACLKTRSEEEWRPNYFLSSSERPWAYSTAPERHDKFKWKVYCDNKRQRQSAASSATSRRAPHPPSSASVSCPLLGDGIGGMPAGPSLTA